MSKSGSSRGLLIFIAILLIGATAGGFYYWKEHAEQPPEFTTATVSKGDVVQAVTATGDLQPVTTIDVSSQISGLITEVLVDYNTPVTKGQVLAKIDTATYEQKLKQANADLEAAEANYTLTRLNTERIRELRTKNLVSQQELEQSEAQLTQAHATFLTRTAAVEDAKVNLARCTIKTPIDGIVISRQADVGRTVAASLNAPTLFTIVNDLTKMQINAAVAEADIGNVEGEQSVNFTVDAFPGRQFRGRVSQIRNSPKTNQNVVTYETIIDVRNDDLKLKPGMTANVSIVVAQRNSVLRIPNSTLRVRIPEPLQSKVIAEAKPGSPAGETKTGAPAKALSDDERRKAMRSIMQEVGFSPGSGPPTPEMMQKAEELAKQRGLDLDFSRLANRGNRQGGGGGGGGGGRSSGAGTTAAPVTRTVYKVIDANPKNPRFASVSIKLGISDGITTEVLDGAAEGDALVTSVTIPGSGPASGAPTNPFNGGGRNPFGPGGGRRL